MGTAAFNGAAASGRLDSENWLFAYWALLLAWGVVLVYGFVWLVRRIGFVGGVGLLAAATTAMLILAFARRSELVR